MQHTSRLLSAASLLLAASGLLFNGCSGGASSAGGGGAGSGNGVLKLSVTDGPFQFDIVKSASVSVDKITIFHDADSDAGPIVLYEGAPILLDLFHLRDGLSQEVDQSTLPVGTYRQLRLRVADAELTLTNDSHYTTDDDTIRLTSQGTSGFKVFVDPPIVIQDGQTSDVLLDFDLTHTFRPVPGNDALSARFYHLHPVIHVSNLGNVGGLQGTVTEDDGAGGLVPASQATVYAMPPGQTDTSLAVVSTGTSDTGTYTILGLTPGPYDVIGVKGDRSALKTGITIESGEVTVVDLTLHQTGGIQGTVTEWNGSGAQVPVGSARVYALPPGQTDPALAVASALTDAAGAYSMPIVPVGTYDVRAINDKLNGTSAGVVVAAGAVTQADITLLTAAIDGTVSQDNGSGGLMPVDAATVYLMPPGQTDPALAVASSVTDATGAYSMLIVPAGTYDVRAVKDVLTGTVPGLILISGSIAHVNITIH